MVAARAALDANGGAFELRYDDGTLVTGAVSSGWEITLNRHPCTGDSDGGFYTANAGPFQVEDSPCPHAVGVGNLLAELASKLSLDEAATNLQGVVARLNPGKPLSVKGLEWVWEDSSGVWARGAELLRPRAIQFSHVGELAESVPARDPAYVPQRSLFDRLDAMAASPRYGSVLLVGPSGHGKSFGARQWCAARGRPLFEATLGVDSRVEDVIGGVGLENGSTVQRDGLVRILQQPGGTLILNELTAVNQREWTSLWPFLEKGATVVRTVVEGQAVSIPVHPTAMVIATANEAKGLHAEANGGQGFAQLRRFTVIRVEMTVKEMVKAAQVIAAQELKGTTISLGAGGSYEILDRTSALELLDFKRFEKLAAHLSGSAEVGEVLEVSPEIIAIAALDAANPVIGVQEALISHFVLKASSLWGQETVARAIAASGIFPEAAGIFGAKVENSA